jgi:hypothetical protein
MSCLVAAADGGRSIARVEKRKGARLELRRTPRGFLSWWVEAILHTLGRRASAFFFEDVAEVE